MEQISVKYALKGNIFFRENAFENVVWKLLAILLGPRCGNLSEAMVWIRQGIPGHRAILSSNIALQHSTFYSQRKHDARITSLLRQNDVATSIWRNNDVFINFILVLFIRTF